MGVNRHFGLWMQRMVLFHKLSLVFVIIIKRCAAASAGRLATGTIGQSVEPTTRTGRNL